MRDELVTVEDNRTYKKNPARGTVVNTDNHAYNARRKKIQAERVREQRLDKLENDVTEIKDLLKQLVERR